MATESLLPGIGGEFGISEGTEIVQDVHEPHSLQLESGQQWSIDVPAETKLHIRVENGICEVFGTELATGVEYTFSGWKFGVYAVEDSELQWRCGQIFNHGLNITENTTQNYVYNLHFSLERVRDSSFDGPRCLILGGSSSGKTSLCRILSSYAIKSKPYQPMFVNLNPEEPIFAPPGCLTATPVSDLLDAQLPSWGQSMTSGATSLHSKQPLVRSFGLETIAENQPWYMENVGLLQKDVSARLQHDTWVRRSGLIIDTPALNKFDDQLTELTHILTKFNVNVVVQVGELEPEIAQRWEAILQQVPSNSVSVIRMPQLSGASENTDTYKRALQRLAIKDYFYGSLGTVLSPYTIGIDSDDLVVWRLPTKASADAMEEPLILLPVEVNASSLQHALLTFQYAARKAEPDEVKYSSILGFGLVTDVNEKKRKLRVLMPVPGRLPNSASILTSYRYLE